MKQLKQELNNKVPYNIIKKRKKKRKSSFRFLFSNYLVINTD